MGVWEADNEMGGGTKSGGAKTKGYVWGRQRD